MGRPGFHQDPHGQGRQGALLLLVLLLGGYCWGCCWGLLLLLRLGLLLGVTAGDAGALIWGLTCLLWKQRCAST